MAVVYTGTEQPFTSMDATGNLIAGKCALLLSQDCHALRLCCSLNSSDRTGAIRAAQFARDKVWDVEARRLRRSFCRGPSDVGGFVDDYSFLVSGLLDLHAASGDAQWLRFALQLQAAQDELFWDSTAGALSSNSVWSVLESQDSCLVCWGCRPIQCVVCLVLEVQFQLVMGYPAGMGGHPFML